LFERESLARKAALHERSELFVRSLADEIANRATEKLLLRNAEPILVRLVDETVSLLAGDDGDEYGRRTHRVSFELNTPITNGMMIIGRRFSLFFVGFLISGCSQAQRKPIIDATLANKNARRESVETALQDLDKHPEYVDEMYVDARRHPPTLNRLEADASRDLKDPEFARSTAAIAVLEPEGVAQAMTAIVKAMADQPVTRAAVDHALTENASAVIDIVKDDHETMEALVHAEIQAAENSEKARVALVAAIKKDAPSFVKLLARDPNLLRDLIGPMFAALDASPESRQALVNAVNVAAPRVVQIASEDPKLLAQLTESLLKASL